MSQDTVISQELKQEFKLNKKFKLKNQLAKIKF